MTNEKIWGHLTTFRCACVTSISPDSCVPEVFVELSDIFDNFEKS